jgi:hypothetical protein
MTQRSREMHFVFLFVVGLLAWIVPGSGHLVLKEKKHAVIIFTVIVLTFITGLYIGSVGVIDPVRAKPWYIAQIMNSPAVAVLGHLNTDWLLFHAGQENQNDLNSGIIPETLKEQFRQHGISLSDQAEVTAESPGYKWLIKDTQRAYRIIRERAGLNIYPDFTVYGRPNEIGQIYTSIAGLLNLLCIVNAVYWAHLRRTETA